jgi:hypothetical protein
LVGAHVRAQTASCWARASSAIAWASSESVGHDRCACASVRAVWQQALAILEDLQHPDADQVRAKLASTDDRASSNPSR